MLPDGKDVFAIFINTISTLAPPALPGGGSAGSGAGRGRGARANACWGPRPPWAESWEGGPGCSEGGEGGHVLTRAVRATPPATAWWRSN